MFLLASLASGSHIASSLAACFLICSLELFVEVFVRKRDYMVPYPLHMMKDMSKYM